MQNLHVMTFFTFAAFYYSDMKIFLNSYPNPTGMTAIIQSFLVCLSLSLSLVGVNRSVCPPGELLQFCRQIRS